MFCNFWWSSSVSPTVTLLLGIWVSNNHEKCNWSYVWHPANTQVDKKALTKFSRNFSHLKRLQHVLALQVCFYVRRLPAKVRMTVCARLWTETSRNACTLSQPLRYCHCIQSDQILWSNQMFVNYIRIQVLYVLQALNKVVMNDSGLTSQFVAAWLLLIGVQVWSGRSIVASTWIHDETVLKIWMNRVVTMWPAIVFCLKK